MPATIPWRVRRRWPNAYLWALYALAGCSNGVIEPIVAPVTLDAAVGDADLAADADADFDEGRGRRDGGPDRPRCEGVAAEWPDSASVAESMLFDTLVELRASPPAFCRDAVPAVFGLRSHADLQCVARLGAIRGPIYDGTDELIFARNNNDLDLNDREQRAGIPENTVRLELLIMNAESPKEIREQLREAPGDACDVFDPSLQLVGIARRENFWTIDFARWPRRP
jgi:hypothetical protein